MNIVQPRVPSVEELAREAFANIPRYISGGEHTAAFGMMSKHGLTDPKIYAAIVEAVHALQKRKDERSQSSVAVLSGPPNTGSFAARTAAARARIEDEAPDWGSVDDPKNERFN